MTVLLFGRDLSHYVISAKRILAYKGIPYETEHVPYHDHQAVIAASGQDYIPLLQWDGKPVVWHEIPDFLEEKRPTPTLYPRGQKHLARILDRWAHEVVEEAVWKYILPEAPATFADPRERWVFVEMQERRRGPLEVMAMRKGEFQKGLVDALGPVEDLLGGSPWLLGAEPSLADFALYGALWPVPYTKNEMPKELPRVRDWFQRVGELEA